MGSANGAVQILYPMVNFVRLLLHLMRAAIEFARIRGDAFGFPADFSRGGPFRGEAALSGARRDSCFRAGREGFLP